MLKKTLILTLAIVVAFGVLLLTARSATFLVRDALLIDQDPVRVWQVLADVEHWPEWWPGVEAARLGSSWIPGEPLELLLKGNPADGPARIERYQVGLELAFSREGVLGSRVGSAFHLEASPGAVRVTVESAVRGPQAILARLTGREAFADYHQRLLAALSKRAHHDDLSGALEEPPDGR